MEKSCLINVSDIVWDDGLSFADMGLPDILTANLKQNGYVCPSPVQRCALPPARLGIDLIIRAKSGTGKTLVMVIIALENVLNMNASSKGDCRLPPVILIIAPTREIAIQIRDVCCKLARGILSPTSFHLLIGGTKFIMPPSASCIFIGTPGRISHMLTMKPDYFDRLRILMFDEADKLFGCSSLSGTVTDICLRLPHSKQTIALSATYPPRILKLIGGNMRDYKFIKISNKSQCPVAITHFFKLCSSICQPIKLLESILSSFIFNQCVIFCNTITSAKSSCEFLCARGFNTVFLSSALDQTERNQSMQKMRNLTSRILVTTDLASRGIDIPSVDLVLNLDLPADAETYLHRVGRCGRFGTYGTSISLLTSESDLSRLKTFSSKFAFPLMSLSLSFEEKNETREEEEEEAKDICSQNSNNPSPQLININESDTLELIKEFNTKCSACIGSATSAFREELSIVSHLFRKSETLVSKCNDLNKENILAVSVSASVCSLSEHAYKSDKKKSDYQQKSEAAGASSFRRFRHALMKDFVPNLVCRKKSITEQHMFASCLSLKIRSNFELYDARRKALYPTSSIY